MCTGTRRYKHAHETVRSYPLELTVLLGRSCIEVWQLTDLRAETYQAGSLEATETIAAENGTPRVLLAPELGLAVLSYFCRFSRNIWDSLMFCDIHSHPFGLLHIAGPSYLGDAGRNQNSENATPRGPRLPMA